MVWNVSIEVKGSVRDSFSPYPELGSLEVPQFSGIWNATSDSLSNVVAIAHPQTTSAFLVVVFFYLFSIFLGRGCTRPGPIAILTEKKEDQKERELCRGGLSGPAVTRMAVIAAEGRTISIYIFLTLLPAAVEEELCKQKMETISPGTGKASSLRCHNLILITSIEVSATF